MGDISAVISDKCQNSPYLDPHSQFRVCGGDLNIFTIIPVELLGHILTFCHPWDVSSFAQSCRSAHALVYHPSDQHLWRELFLLHPFDDPRGSQRPSAINALVYTPPTIDWRYELKRRMKTERILCSLQPLDLESRTFALDTLISAVHGTPPNTSLKEEPQLSGNILWVERVLRQSRILDIQIDAHTAPGDVLLLAQLRSYTALTFDDDHDEAAKGRMIQRRNKSRSFVYDLRNYNSDNNWGPYLYDGGVNWVHIECLIDVILMNLRELPNPWAHTRPPLGLEATRPYTAPATNLSESDWAGVEGTWRRYVCFMDYRDLFAFNYSNLREGPRSPRFFEEPQFREATRLIEVKLHVIPPDHLRFRRPLTRSPRDARPDNRYPPLYFSGSSKGVNGNEAVVEGVVWMGRDNVVRWKFASIYAGNMQWSSDGAQVGNIGCALGVVGVWTTSIHDQGDPVGPFWLWKVGDNYPAHLMEYT